MLAQEIIRKKRDKGTLTKAEIDGFIRGVADKSVGEGQVASFCMAVLLNKMDRDERVALTMAMARSGRMLAWDDLGLDGPVLDKHSTGGIGDKTSLMLAPLIAACGGYVPMISGRGLGHTGGTLDKMDAIPGYVSQPDTPLLRRVVKEVGCAVVGATSDIAPADRTMYAVRDVTATVESLDLITASILSKKLAAGLQGLVMDVKFGSGAFMRDYNDAKALAQSIADVANGAGLPCVALMTDMDQCLGRTAGNAIEVRESIEFLRGENIEPRLYEVTMALVAELLVIGKLATDAKAGHAMAEKQLRSGRAAEIFGRMVKDLGGPADIVEQSDKYLLLAPVVREVKVDNAGVLQAMDARQLGLAIIELGGGRRLVTDKVDHSVGLDHVAAIGATVGSDTPLAVIYARDDAAADKAAAMIRAACTVAPAGTKIPTAPALRERITG
jgi:thymidine phosphorylase